MCNCCYPRCPYCGHKTYSYTRPWPYYHEPYYWPNYREIPRRERVIIERNISRPESIESALAKAHVALT